MQHMVFIMHLRRLAASTIRVDLRSDRAAYTVNYLLMMNS